MASSWKKISLFLAIAPAIAAADLPIVDLGYELHQAYSYNLTTGLYNFSNIRYAAPPLGDLRFRAPIPPEVNRTLVHKGDVGRMCPQASTLWASDIAPKFIVDYFLGETYNGTQNISSLPYKFPQQDPRTTEDCLFLDVVVPKKVFARESITCGEERPLAPVLVWIYGGGYTFGDKSEYDPSGLLERSKDGIIFVTMNYRLGAFGWLAGPSMAHHGTPNAGLYDQRLALDWVYKYIHLFGGDPKRVTVMGESAGGGSIMHQITAFGGNKGPAPFQQAIIQSPGFEPIPEPQAQETTLQEFLRLLNVSSIDDARKLCSDALIRANVYQVSESAYGTFTYGPVVDGAFVPALPGELLLHGDFDTNINIMTGHNADEGLDFTPPASQTNSGLPELLVSEFPGIPAAVVKYVSEDLYPPVYNGSYTYKNPVARVAEAVSDVAFVCNTDYINRAFHNRTYAYQFSVAPALHGQDVPYTFYNGPSSKVSNVTIAMIMQDYFTSFTETGTPRSSLSPEFPLLGTEQNMVDLAVDGVEIVPDNASNGRCLYWQTAPYYVPPKRNSTSSSTAPTSCPSFTY